MREFMKIVETITTDQDLNFRIEQIVDHEPVDDRPLILDGLEIIYQKGQEGVDVSSWVEGMRVIHGAVAIDKLKEIMRFILSNFQFCVQRSAHGKYVWKEHMSDAEDTDPELAAMAGTQVEITYHILEVMKQMGTFTERDILAALATLGLSPQMCHMFFEHILTTFGGKSIVKNGDHYTFKEEAPKTQSDHMQGFRDMLNAPVK